MVRRRLLRALPLAILTATLVGLVGGRLLRRSAPERAPLGDGAPSAASPPSASARPPLASTKPLGSGPAQGGAATTLHGDAARTHRSVAIAPRAPKERWTTAVGGSVVAQPVLAPDERTVYVTTLAGDLVALDRAGHVTSRTPLGERAYATPLIGRDGTVFVGSDAKRFCAFGGRGAEASASDAAAGTSAPPPLSVRWRLDVDGEADVAAVFASPTRIAFAAGATLYLVSPEGEVKARFRAKKKIFTAPAADAAGRVYFGSQDHHAYALGSDGALLWAVDLGADVEGGPVVTDDGHVYFGTDGGLVARVRAVDGVVVAKTVMPGHVRGALSLGRDGTLLAGVYGPTAAVLRVDEGRVVGEWRIAGPSSRDFGVHGGPLEDGEGTLLFGAQDDAVYAVERSGRLRFRLARGGDVDAPLTLTSDGSLIVAGDDGKVSELGD